MQRFTSECTIHFNDCDPAGILFFANVFSLAHLTFEKFLLQTPKAYENYFKNPQFAFPLIKAESQYQRPLQLGETYEIQMHLVELKTSSFKLDFSFKKQDQVYAQVSTVHVTLDKQTKQKAELPDFLRSLLIDKLQN